MALTNFKKGDKVYIYKPTSSWKDTHLGIKDGVIKLNKPYTVVKLYDEPFYGLSVVLSIGPKDFENWSLGVDCLKLWRRTSKPTWL